MTLLPGDCLEQLKSLDPNSIDSLVTDPPAGISFMGKAWDGDFGGASRFFYVAKASKSERNAGLEGMPVKTVDRYGECGQGSSPQQAPRVTRAETNFHPTVKSQKLMQYLIRMITPPQGTVLDPFMGSGSTGVAAKTLGFNFIGIEREPDYFKIAEKRIFNAFPEFKKQVKA